MFASLNAKADNSALASYIPMPKTANGTQIDSYSYLKFDTHTPRSNNTGEVGRANLYFNWVRSTNMASNNYAKLSSRHIKKDINDLTEDEAKKILKLTPITYHMKFLDDKNLKYGLIAEDVQKILPDIVMVPDGYKEEDFNENLGMAQDVIGLDYTSLIPHLIKMVQIQQKQIDKLQATLSNIIFNEQTS